MFTSHQAVATDVKKPALAPVFLANSGITEQRKQLERKRQQRKRQLQERMPQQLQERKLQQQERKLQPELLLFCRKRTEQRPAEQQRGATVSFVNTFESEC
ncbi:hypothetical protein PQU96_09475 [Vogesella sp. LYT5W]|uniref:Uncharacterized protein n=1 Tax=Vogesella margarita TaxID=2984199 RepID=A0ABT5IP63_9NEIS|nr:hypothetical protein [Vogesella margarita]MDC7714356.1 hypothetical protein [Vogesella margarita]